MNPAPPVTRRLPISGPFPGLQQIRPVPGLDQLHRTLLQLGIGEESLSPRDLFGHADPQPGAPLHRADIVGGVGHLIERARVEPRRAAGQHLDLQLAALQVCAVHIRDLVLTARRRLQVPGDLDHIVVSRNTGPAPRSCCSGPPASPPDDIARPSGSNSTTPYAEGSATQYAKIAPPSTSEYRFNCVPSPGP